MSQKKQKVEARTLKGFVDYLPQEALERRRLLASMVPIFDRYGFAPLESPVVEHLDVLLGSGGEGTNKELFRFESPEEEPVALRFDQTVPFARVLAQYPEEIKLPFRRYAHGPVFRADKPGPGRFRQFTQIDFDAAGSPDLAVDAEICAVLCEVMAALGVGDYRLEVNTRRLVDALLAEIGITEPEVQRHVLRVIDKLAKVGLDNVRLELGSGRIDESGDPIRGVGLDAKRIDRLVAFLALGGGSRVAVIEAVDRFLAPSAAKDAALADLRELHANFDALGLQESHVVIDPSLARGLDYYTGPVFEMKLPAAPQFGTVAAGGRYDQLVERFSSIPVTATGASFGLDRLRAALGSLESQDRPRSLTQVLIVTFKGMPRAPYLKLAQELRAAGINTEVYFGKRKAGVADQLSKANDLKIPFAVIAGEDEFAAGEVALKDLRAGAEARAHLEDREAYRAAGKAGQITIPRSDLISELRRLLG